MKSSASRRPNRLLVNSLRLRLEVQFTELDTCTTAAMGLCVAQSIADTSRQLKEALG